MTHANIVFRDGKLMLTFQLYVVSFQGVDCHFAGHSLHLKKNQSYLISRLPENAFVTVNSLIITSVFKVRYL